MSWSHGEVTKPETINYRTLKPERDGLFCEKIFGPVKDWECHCGKYKRYRYKGIICDKCGVEVTRSKVRRERMGHVRLATPVSHIWYFKGIPSRVGLLLDMSPRNLERVIYFSSYIVTSVDDEAKRTLLEKWASGDDEKGTSLKQELSQKTNELRQNMEASLVEQETENERMVQEVEKQMETSTTLVMEQVEELQARIKESQGKKAVRDFVLGEGANIDLVLKKGEVFDPNKQINLAERAVKLVGRIETDYTKQQERLRSAIAKKSSVQEKEVEKEIGKLESQLLKDLAGVEAELEASKNSLTELSEKQLLTDAQYREYTEKFGKVFKAGIGAAAIRELLGRINLNEESYALREEAKRSTGQKRLKAVKRLKTMDALRRSGTSPTWMIMDVLPVLPPELRPMVQLDGGRFATSDLNDLYRRVINRNNRLKRLKELGAPEIIIRNEKRMLQEAVDALIDNGRRGKAITGTSNRKLKSLSDMLKGKQGRFRQNLLGKRVDYSGRSVIVVGPDLALDQCGIPKKMALELFKPFVMSKLVERGISNNIKSAKRMVERARPEVWDILDEVIHQRPVLLNRAPTLHRLGIQAFMPVLVEGSAIQVHPLVCHAFNADFDGDQMAVHVPLFSGAVSEAHHLMMPSQNILSASDGHPVISPTQDVVLGAYYLTAVRNAETKDIEDSKLHQYGTLQEAMMSYHQKRVSLQEEICVRFNGQRIRTTAGRVIFNDILPLGKEPQNGDGEVLGFQNQVMDKKALRNLVSVIYRLYGNELTAIIANEIKRVGFEYATKAGVTISAMDIKTPQQKKGILENTDKQVADIDVQLRRGLITEEERYERVVELWTAATQEVTEATMKNFDRFSPVFMMSTSGARGDIQQIRQLAGMRGLMADPTGRIIDLPIKSNFSEGLTVLEFFISTHGARKGLADTALRTADSGYLTRRLVDVSQDVIIREEDCGSNEGIWVSELSETNALIEPLFERLAGRYAAKDIVDPLTNELLVVGGQAIEDDTALRIISSGVSSVKVRSVLNCLAHAGVCQKCYGRNLATGKLVEIGEAVGVIAAQSIGEPGTQLTMRTFHTGGIAGSDITHGLPRVEELFEARIPKGQAIISEIEGIAEILTDDKNVRHVRVVQKDEYTSSYPVEKGMAPVVSLGDLVKEGGPLAKTKDVKKGIKSDGIYSRHAGTVMAVKKEIVVKSSDEETRQYTIPHGSSIKLQEGEKVQAGTHITEGSVNPQELMEILGRESVQRYLVEEVQKVYRSQGVDINDKHIEVIVRQMMRKVRVASSGDTELLPGDIVSVNEYEIANRRALAEGGEPALASTVLLGLIKAALNTSSWLSAASFQETTRVLTEASLSGKIDRLAGLKENVIIGKLIPAGTGLNYYQKLRAERAKIAAENNDEQDDEEMVGGVTPDDIDSLMLK